MTKARIIYTLILAAVLSVYVAVYQFYFKGKLEVYRQDVQLKDTMERSYEDLKTTFMGVKPEVIVREWRSQVQPWSDTVLTRAKYFNYGDWFTPFETIPVQNAGILRFTFDEMVNRMIDDLYKRVGERMGRYDLFPADIQEQLRIPTLNELAGVDVTQDEVKEYLARLNFGIRLCNLLLDAKASSISQVSIWPVRKEKDLLDYQTAGMSFTIAMKDLVNLFEDKLHTSDRYFSIDALKITYPYVGYNFDPQLNVEMLLTQAAFSGMPEPKPSEAGGPPAAPGSPEARAGGQPSARDEFGRSMNRPPRPQPKAPGFFGKAWKLFKRYVLYSN
ncbi:MAG TPA: hypothetical protein PLI09_24065 [Candidatus Hydrogenedentes bacterium]|nr:hypothetical protein [Candidatus Hydrogenedentota bacterium]